MTTISSGTRQLLNFAMLRDIGPKTLRQISKVEDLPSLSHVDMAHRVPALARVLDAASWDRAQAAAEHQIEQAKQSGTRILSPLDPNYPTLLLATEDDPCLLWVQGQLSATPERSVAIIGPREPTHHGELIATRVTQFFIEQDWSVVSGLALGCDAIAHESALQAEGHTVAVLAHGLQMVSPAKNKKLAERILAKGGALVSEFPFGQTAKPHQFVKRDRTQAGLAQGVVMVQSDLKGGSLHATRAALSYQRWIAVPYPTVHDRSSLAPKIQANLVIANGTPAEKQKLLQCSSSALNQIVILNGREDYPDLVNGTRDYGSAAQPRQSSLI